MPVTAAEVQKELQGKSAKEIAQILTAKSESLQKEFAEKVVEKDGQKTYNTTIAELEEYRGRQQELTEIGKVYDAVEAVEQGEKDHRERMEKIQTIPVNPITFPGNADPSKKQINVTSLGQLLINSPEYKAKKAAGTLDSPDSWTVSLNGLEFKTEAEFKTTMTTGAGFAPANDRTDIVILSAQEEPAIQNYIPSVTTDLDSIKYMDESTFTNNMTGTAENAALTEVAIAYTERSQVVENLGGFLPVTEQQLDVPEGVAQLVDQRLVFMYQQIEQRRLLTGSGSTPQILGYHNKSAIQTQALGADAKPDAIFKGMVKVRHTGQAEPDLIVYHPNDWQDFRLLKDGNGNYIWGNPAEAGPERIWGKPILQSVDETEGTALIGAFRRYSTIWRKRGARVEVGIQNDDFVKMKKTIRIYGRLALVIYRAGAYCTVTGL